MLSSEQIRAARGLLGWSQLDLAKNCALSKTAINNLERGLVKPRTQTLEIIQTKLEAEGVEFIGEYGVNLKKEIFSVQTFDGIDAYRFYLEDLINTIKGSGLEALHYNVDENILIEMGYEDDLKSYYDQFIRFGCRSERLLVCEGDLMRFGPERTSTYRWMSKELFSVNGYSIYGNKYSIFLFEPSIRVIIIESPPLAQAYRKQFDLTWKFSKSHPNKNSHYEKITNIY